MLRRKNIWHFIDVVGGGLPTNAPETLTISFYDELWNQCDGNIWVTFGGGSYLSFNTSIYNYIEILETSNCSTNVKTGPVPEFTDIPVNLSISYANTGYNFNPITAKFKAVLSRK